MKARHGGRCRQVSQSPEGFERVWGGECGLDLVPGEVRVGGRLAVLESEGVRAMRWGWRLGGGTPTCLPTPGWRASGSCVAAG